MSKVTDKKIENNFHDICKYITEKTGINLLEEYLDIEKVPKETFTNLDNIVYEDPYQVITDDSKSSSKYDPPLPYDQLPDHLKNDVVHAWRAKTGIELIHKEPTIKELNRIWANWQLMDDEQKRISDEKSIELFGMDNQTHYYYLLNNEYVNESYDYFEEKSHSKLKYCYRIGFDINTGEQVAIQFDLDPNKINFVGDRRNTRKAFEVQTGGDINISNELLNRAHNHALSEVKNKIQKYGHIDFVTDELPVSAIFYKDGKSLKSVELIPMFSKPVVDCVNRSFSRFKGIDVKESNIKELYNMPMFKQSLVLSLKRNNIVGEKYEVGAIGGKDKYKTTKLLWDSDLFKSYTFTPMIRGYNIRGDYWNQENMMKYDLTNKFKSIEEEVDFITDMSLCAYPTYTSFNQEPVFDNRKLQMYIETNNIEGINEMLNPNMEDLFFKYMKYTGVSLIKKEENYLYMENDYFKVLKSDLDKDYKPKKRRSLSEFKKMNITKDLIKKFAKQGKLIKYMRDTSPKYDDECFLWVDEDGDYVASITYDSKPDKDGHKWISGMDVAYKYNGCGLGHQLLDYAISNGVDALSVQVDNEIALRMYKKHGFKISDESQKKIDTGKSKQYDMFFKRKKLPSTNQDRIDKEIKESLNWINKFVYSDIFRENIDVDPFTLSTPEEFLKWMDCIQYGWIDKSGNVQGTGEDDDEQDFYDEYRLQSPVQLIESKIGVCWDQAELERKWFTKHNFICGIFYIEIDDGENQPTHTFLIYKTNDGFNWFEHSWNDMKGIHKYNSLNKAIKDVVNKHQTWNNNTSSPVIVTCLNDIPKYGCTCEEFMLFARDQKRIICI